MGRPKAPVRPETPQTRRMVHLQRRERHPFLLSPQAGRNAIQNAIRLHWPQCRLQLPWERGVKSEKEE